MFTRTVHWQSENGKTAQFGALPYLVRTISDSLGGEEQVVKAPGQDGATTYRVTLGRPVINLIGSIHAPPGTIDERRAWLDRAEIELGRAFAPDRFGLLRDISPGMDRRIRCRPMAKPVLGPIVGFSRSVDIEFIADISRWETWEETIEELGREIGGFRFPLFLPTRVGLYRKNANIINDTGESIWPAIEVYTASELVSVTNRTSGKKVQINRPVAEGQKLVIDMAATRADIYQMDEDNNWQPVEDASNWLTYDSEYWPLQPGNNYIVINNETMDSGLVAVIRYRESL